MPPVESLNQVLEINSWSFVSKCEKRYLYLERCILKVYLIRNYLSTLIYLRLPYKRVTYLKVILTKYGTMYTLSLYTRPFLKCKLLEFCTFSTQRHEAFRCFSSEMQLSPNCGDMAHLPHMLHVCKDTQQPIIWL